MENEVTHEVTENEVRKTEMIFFLWLHHKDATNRSVKDWVRQMCSRIRCVAENPQSEANNKPIEVEMADNDYFFNSKKYKSLLEAAKDCGISSNSAIKCALDNGRHFVKRRSDKKIFYVRPVN